MTRTLTDVLPRIEELDQGELYRKIFEVSPASIAIVTADDGRFVKVNDGFLRLLACERGDLLGQALDELDATFEITGEAETQMPAPDEARSDDGALHWQNVRIVTPTGDTREAIGSFVPFAMDREDYVLYKLVDVTPMRRLEREVLEASDREQRRIGDELHDSLGNPLTRLSMYAQVLPFALGEGDADKARELSRKLHETAKKTVEEARRMIHGLLPAVLTQQGLVPALRELAEQTSELHAVRCDVRCSDAAEASLEAASEQTIHLYRISQEAVHNAVKHGGSTHIAMVLERAERAMLRLTIRDDGNGFDPSNGESDHGAGLRSMQYRARLIGATLDVRTEENGVAVTCLFPSAPDGVAAERQGPR